LQKSGTDHARESARAEAWLLISSAIARYLRFHARRLGKFTREDLEDLASQKSLDLLRRIERGKWRMSGRESSDISGFLSKVARNGLLDLLHQAERRYRQPASKLGPASGDSKEMDGGAYIEETTASMTDPPDTLVDGREFAAALRGCAEQLNARSLTIWILRVFAEMSSRQIAAHPEVSLKVGHVDVVFQRTRKAIGTCMRGKGYEPQDIPPCAFVELWRAFRIGREQPLANPSDFRGETP